jgi:hypothetical protein
MEAHFAAFDALAAVHRACHLHGAYYCDRVVLLCGVGKAAICLLSLLRLAGADPVPSQRGGHVLCCARTGHLAWDFFFGALVPLSSDGSVSKLAGRRLSTRRFDVGQR